MIIYVNKRYENLLLILVFIVIYIITIRSHFKIYKQRSIYSSILYPLEIEKGIYLFSAFLERRELRLITYNKKFCNYSVTITMNFSFNSFKIYTTSGVNYKGVHNNYWNYIFKFSREENYSNKIYSSNNRLIPINTINIRSKYKLILCLTTLFSYDNKYRFIEFIEYYRYFGVEKLVVYNTNCSNDIKKILIYYKKIGLMDIIFDNYTHNLFEPKRFHVWKQNDCFYRYKYSAEKMIFTDHDEIIYSPLYNTSYDFFSHLNYKASTFHFYPKLTITFGKGFFNTGYYTICPNDPWKFIINQPLCILQVVVHDIILRRNRKCFKEIVSTEVGYILHARNLPSTCSWRCKNWSLEMSYAKKQQNLYNQAKIIESIIFKKYL